MRCLLLIAFVACTSGERSRSGSGSGSGSGSIAIADAAPTAVDGSASTSRLSITFSEAKPRGAGLGARCRLGGDPLATTCDLREHAIAIDAAGRVYAVDGKTVRRYRLTTATATDCELAIDPTFASAGVLAQPTIEPPGQRLEGTVYLSSRESWQLYAGGAETMYYAELLRGVHRIDRGRVEPVCPALQGVDGLVMTGKQAIVSRADVERVTLAGRCRTQALAYEPEPRTVHAVHGEVWGEANGRVHRYDKAGKSIVAVGAADAFGPGGFCSVIGVAACGADVCVADQNCMKVVRYTTDGTVVRTYEDEDLFATRPHALVGAATAPDGALFLAATHKDGDTCEGAIYRLP